MLTLKLGSLRSLSGNTQSNTEKPYGYPPVSVTQYCTLKWPGATAGAFIGSLSYLSPPTCQVCQSGYPGKDLRTQQNSGNPKDGGGGEEKKAMKQIGKNKLHPNPKKAGMLDSGSPGIPSGRK